MIVLVRNDDNVVVAIGKDARQEVNGLFLDGAIYPLDALNLTRHDVASVPVGVKPQLYCFDGSVFSVNANYKPPFDAQVEIETIKKALDELILGGAL